MTCGILAELVLLATIADDILEAKLAGLIVVLLEEIEVCDGIVFDLVLVIVVIDARPVVPKEELDVDSVVL